MGLDCLPVGVPKLGSESKWRELMEKAYKKQKFPAGKESLFREIVIQPYACVNAPLIGESAEANAWALSKKASDNDISDAEFIGEMSGYYVLPLVKDCAGLPKYTNAGLYKGVDETSFRGEFLSDCEALIGADLVARAWTNYMRPEEAVDFGEVLLDHAVAARMRDDAGNPAVRKQIDILECAGRWYRFWGEKGHPIQAYW